MDNTNKTFGARSHEEQERARDDYQARTSSLRSVGKPIRKKDSMQLLLGQAKYTADLAPQDCLTVKLLRSPHANAIVEEIDTTAALKVDGIRSEIHAGGPDLPGIQSLRPSSAGPACTILRRSCCDRRRAG